MALPNYRIEINKVYQSHRWANDYLLNCIDMDEAEAAGTALLEFERRLHNNVVLFEGWTVSTTAPGDRIFRHHPSNQNGYGGDSGDKLPLWNVLRIDLTTLESDPGRKYYRLPVHESFTTDMMFTGAQISAWQAVIVTYLANTVALDNLVTPRGNVIVGATVHPYVQMRQLHRRRRQKPPEEA